VLCFELQMLSEPVASGVCWLFPIHAHLRSRRSSRGAISQIDCCWRKCGAAAPHPTVPSHPALWLHTTHLHSCWGDLHCQTRMSQELHFFSLCVCAYSCSDFLPNCPTASQTSCFNLPIIAVALQATLREHSNEHWIATELRNPPLPNINPSRRMICHPLNSVGKVSGALSVQKVLSSSHSCCGRL